MNRPIFIAHDGRVLIQRDWTQRLHINAIASALVRELITQADADQMFSAAGMPEHRATALVEKMRANRARHLAKTTKEGTAS